MKQQTIKSLSIDVPVSVPESVEEFNKNAWGADTGNGNPCLTEAVDNVLYRGWLAQFRPTFLHGQDADPAHNIAEIKGVEEVTGIERKCTKDKDGNIEEYTETEGNYFKRVCAETGREPSTFQDLANSVANSIPFDASASERKPMLPKKTAKVYLDAADQLIKEGKAEAVAAALSGVLSQKFEPTRESLGKAIALHEAKKRAEAQKTLANDLAAMVQA